MPVGECKLRCDDESVMTIFYRQEKAKGTAAVVSKPLIGRDPHNSGSKPVKIVWATGITAPVQMRSSTICIDDKMPAYTNGDVITFEGWFDNNLLDSKTNSAKGLATGVLRTPAGTIQGDFRHRLGNGALKVSGMPGSMRFLVPLSGSHTWPNGCARFQSILPSLKYCDSHHCHL